MTDDLTLLRAYATEGSEEAFRTVVDRHLALVHAAALRQVGDEHLAQEVTQAVFLVLARKAGTLRPGTLVSGWLFRTTRFAAAQVLRSARRRQHYEKEAATMLPTLTDPEPGPESRWEDIAPFLDDAVASLGEADRRAILLRFFERQDLRTVGASMGSTEEAAKKRVARALERLHRYFRRRGATLSLTALGTVLVNQAVPAMPAPVLQSLSAALTAHARAGAAATQSAATLVALQTMKAMFLAQVQKIALLTAAVLTVAAGVGWVAANASGSAPAPSASFRGSPMDLTWDAGERRYKSSPGEVQVPFQFTFTNETASTVAIRAIRPSCGCTVLQGNRVFPFTVPPGASDRIQLSMNLAGKSGTVIKAVTVDTTAGTTRLLLRVDIPGVATNGLAVSGSGSAAEDARRSGNLLASAVNPQAIFRGDCARCHADPAKGKEGMALYSVSCGICHDAEHRASMVPDLKALTHPTSPEFWESVIANGRPGTLMPSFSQQHGGNLTPTQIASLARYLGETIPAAPRATTASASR